jgi:hypothetical protein
MDPGWSDENFLANKAPSRLARTNSDHVSLPHRTWAITVPSVLVATATATATATRRILDTIVGAPLRSAPSDSRLHCSSYKNRWLGLTGIY